MATKERWAAFGKLTFTRLNAKCKQFLTIDKVVNLGQKMVRQKSKISTKMGLIAGLIILICIAVAVVTLTKPTPAKFEVSDLVLDPSEVEAGRSVEVSIEMKNVGEATGTYTVVLKIDGEVEAAKDIALAGGATQTVSFTITRDAIGTYRVEVGGLSKDLKVYFKLADAVGDASLGFARSYLDIAEIKLTREGPNFVLRMEACEDIPTNMFPLDGGNIYFYFLFDLNKDNSEDFAAEIKINFLGWSVSHGSYVHRGPAITITIPSTEIGDLESFNFRAYSSAYIPWGGEIIDIDNMPDAGWAEVSLV